MHLENYSNGDGAEYGATSNFNLGTKWGFISAGNFLDYSGTDEESYGQLKQKDFNIKEIANGTGKEIIRSFNTTVTDNILEIRLYWAGKGTTCIPVRGTYGPLISAISIMFICLSQGDAVETENLVIEVKFYLDSYGCFKFNCDGEETKLCCIDQLSLRYYFLFFVLWAFYVGDAIVNIKTQEKEMTCLLSDCYWADLKGLDLQTGTFTYRQLKAATNNFDSANKIGEGGFGSVYKAFDLQQKGNLMDLVDENLANEFNKKEAKRMIKVALLSLQCNSITETHHDRGS
ncbi:hypothetical protein Patl1_10339 [Pistacia atlantica]|uniref:Uncharacterized protein n=1 Tax=Pistacia atlantica TaxID=434234 RepID=A0ACC1A976_9ROSI|nr:hypothetical protein Patl1_10339 [Pistacia atlantica]